MMVHANLIFSLASAQRRIFLSLASAYMKIKKTHYCQCSLLLLLKYSPWFMWSRRTALKLYVSQLANRALMRPSRSLKVGVDLAMTQANAQSREVFFLVVLSNIGMESST